MSLTNKENNMVGESVDIGHPIIIVGIGGAGTKLAINCSKLLDCKCLLISDDRKDLEKPYPCIHIDSQSWINPSGYRLRSFVKNFEDQIKSALAGFKTVIIIANLAGKGGVAIAPAVCKIAKENFYVDNVLLSFVIMPFCFEKDRIFQSGISLKRVRELSNAIVVVDNDAFLENSPELSPEECYEITNHALYEVVSSISNRSISPNMNLLCTSKSENNSSAEILLNDSISMLSQNVQSDSIRRVVLYIMRGEKLPIGIINSLVNNLEAIFKDPAGGQIVLSISGSQQMKVHLMAAVKEKTRFDEYDPLGEVISDKDTLDWDEMDSSPEIDIKIPNIE